MTGVKREDKIKIASQFNCNYAIPNLCQLLGQRQMVANFLINSKRDSINDLEAQLDYINNQIKLMLGI